MRRNIQRNTISMLLSLIMILSSLPFNYVPAAAGELIEKGLEESGPAEDTEGSVESADTAGQEGADDPEEVPVLDETDSEEPVILKGYDPADKEEADKHIPKNFAVTLSSGGIIDGGDGRKWLLGTATWDDDEAINTTEVFASCYDSAGNEHEIHYNCRKPFTLERDMWTTKGGTNSVEVGWVVLEDDDTQYDEGLVYGIKKGDKVSLSQCAVYGSTWAMSEPATITFDFNDSCYGQTYTAGASPKINTTSLSDCCVGQPYTLNLEGEAVKGGTLSWAVTAGSLPSGLTLSTEGEISGTPDKAGKSTFTVTLTESYKEEGVSKTITASKEYTLQVGASPTIDTTSIPDARYGIEYKTQLKGTKAVGGDLKWSRSSGSLPKGVDLSEDGLISGTPMEDGTFDFSVELTETGADLPATLPYKLKVIRPKPSITTTSLPNGQKKKPYKVKISAKASSGGSFIWKKTSGKLPDGLSLSTDGEISGTPEKAGDFNFTVTLTEEGVYDSASKEYSVNIADADRFTASFYLNGGKASSTVSSQTIEDGETITLPDAPERRGYNFDGWRSSSGSRGLYKARDEVTITEDTRFSAEWSLKGSIPVTYSEEVVGSVYLVGETADSGSVQLDYEYYSEASNPHFSISPYDLTWYSYKSIGLMAYVDGKSVMIARYDGDPNDFKGEEIELTTVTPSFVVKAVEVTGLTENEDYKVSSIRSKNSNSCRYLPFMSREGAEFTVYLRGIASNGNYSKYDWSKDYSTTAVYDSEVKGGKLTVKPAEVKPDVNVTGHVYYGDGTGVPVPNATVNLSQYAFNLNRTATAVTGEDGSFTLSGYSGSYFSATVTYGGKQVASRYGNFEGGSSLDFHMNSLDAYIRTVIDTGELSENSVAKLNKAIDSIYVELCDPGDNDRYLGGTWVQPGSVGNVSLHNLDGLNTSIKWKVSKGIIETADGSSDVDLTKEDAEIKVPLKLNSGILVDLSSVITSSYGLAWFDGSGKYVGTSWTGYLSATPASILTVCPAKNKSGNFTVALMPRQSAYGLTSLDEAYDDSVLKKWSITLGENGIVELEAFNVTATRTENALYYTKPASTFEAGQENFNDTGDIITFGGHIGLDADTRNGKLQSLRVDPTDKGEQGIHWEAATANIEKMEIGGRIYDADDFTWSSGNYWTLDFTKNGGEIDLPCEYTLYCQPGFDDWDIYTAMSACGYFTNKGGGRTYFSGEPIGNAEVKKPGSKLRTRSAYVCHDEITVDGNAGSGESVSIYDNGIFVGEATADYYGDYSAAITLYGTEEGRRTLHLITAETESGVVSEGLEVYHDSKGPELTKFNMNWYSPYGVYEGRGSREIEVGETVFFVGQMQRLTFTAKFENRDQLEDLYGWKRPVVFKYYTTDGKVGILPGTYDEESDMYYATMADTRYASVTGAEVLYKPKDNKNTVLSYKEGGKVPDVFRMSEGEVNKGLAELGPQVKEDVSTVINASKNEDSMSFAYDAATGNLEVTGGGAANVDDKGKAAFKECEEELLEDGIVLETVDMTFRDEQGIPAWIDGIMKNKEAGLFTRSAYYDKADEFDWEVKAFSDVAYHVTGVRDSDGKKGADRYILTDALQDDEYGITDSEGNLNGTFVVYMDTAYDRTNDLYSIDVSVFIDPDFNGITKEEKNSNAAGIMATPATWDYSESKMKRITEYLYKGGYGEDFGIDKSKFEARNYTIKSKIGLGDGADMSKNAADHGGNAIDSFGRKAGKSAKKVGFVNKLLGWIGIADTIDNAVAGRYSVAEMKKFLDELFNSKCYNALPLEIRDYLQDEYNYFLAMSGLGDDIMRSSVEGVCQTLGKVGKICEKAIPGPAGKGGGFVIGEGSSYMGNQIAELNSSRRDFRVMLCEDLAQNMYCAFSSYLSDWENSDDGKDYAYYKNLSDKWENEIYNPRMHTNRYKFLTDYYEGKKNDCKDKIASMTVQKPKNNKTINDPSGVVFEAVGENVIKDATVTLYYAVDKDGKPVKEVNSANTAHVVPADNVRDLEPAGSVQITGEEGRYSWGVPEGLWYVTVEKGGLSGNSLNDKEAKIKVDADGEDYNLLPVLPVQLNVNIPLVDKSAPYVEKEKYTTDGVYITFSKYMMDGSEEGSCLNHDYYSVKVGDDKTEDFTVESVEQGQVPSNLPDAGKTYTRTVRIKIDGLKAGDNVSLSVNKAVKSYADTGLIESYESGGAVMEPLKLHEPVIILGYEDSEDGEAAAYGSVLTISENGINETESEGAKIYYSIDGEEKREYKGPVPIYNSGDITAWKSAVGCIDSDKAALSVEIEDTVEDFIVGFDSNGGSNVDTQKVKEGETVKKPEAPVKEGNTFICWTLAGAEYDFGTEVHGNMMLKAKWETEQKDPVDENVPVSGISLNLKETTINIGDSITLIATIEPENADDKSVSFATSNASVAGVDNKGKVTGTGLGAAEITVTTTDGAFKAVCKVTVIRKTYSAEAALKEGKVIAGTKVDISSLLNDKGLTGKKKYISSDKKKAKVDKKGLLTGKKESDVTISLDIKDGKTWQKEVSSCNLQIEIPNMLKETTGNANETLNAFTLLESGTDFAPTSWESSKPKVATVDEDGTIHFLKKGTVKIIAVFGEDKKTSSKKKYKTKIKVN